MFLIPAGILGILFFSQIAKLSRGLILTAVVMFSVVGAFAMNNSLTDVWVMFGFGIFGVILERQKVPLAPLILGMILGPKIEEYLRTGLISYRGEFAAAFSSHISRAFIIVLTAIVFFPLLRVIKQKGFK